MARRWSNDPRATRDGMSKIVIDGKEIDVPAEYTLLQACEAAGAEVPRFASTNACRSPAIAACVWSR